jgi:hypothetical protein
MIVDLMHVRKLKTAFLLPAFACSLVAVTAANARADLSASQARKALTQMAGFKLKDSSVRVKSVTATSPPANAGGSDKSRSAAEASAEIKTVFKLDQDKQGNWRVTEIRSAEDTWEAIDIIASALKAPVATGACTAPDPPAKGNAATNPSVKRARCLVASLLGVELPSDAVRIQEVSPSPLPFASQASATVVAWVRVEARLLNDRKGWRVTELRTGNRDWIALDQITAAVNREKQQLARRELEAMAQALDRFHKDRGFFVVSDSQAVAMDHLSPRYLTQVIRVDPWHRSYKYDGDRDHFTLRSAGPDGKADTPDDLIVSNIK